MFRAQLNILLVVHELAPVHAPLKTPLRLKFAQFTATMLVLGRPSSENKSPRVAVDYGLFVSVKKGRS